MTSKQEQRIELLKNIVNLLQVSTAMAITSAEMERMATIDEGEAIRLSGEIGTLRGIEDTIKIFFKTLI